MAKRNYNKISTQPAAEPVECSHVVEPKPEEPESPKLETPTFGVVTNCAKLNIRSKPNIEASVVCEVPITSKLVIDTDKSTDNWFKVCTASGAEGFCMKRFVEVQK